MQTCRRPPGPAVSEVSATSCGSDDHELRTYPQKLEALTVQGLKEEKQHIEQAVQALQPPGDAWPRPCQACSPRQNGVSGERTVQLPVEWSWYTYPQSPYQ
eukprot:4649193-Amphidinium_carterae.1